MSAQIEKRNNCLLNNICSGSPQFIPGIAGIEAVEEEIIAEIAPGLLNKITHIFGKSSHNLDQVVSEFGTPEAALSAIQTSIQQAVESQGIQGVFEGVQVQVGSQTVTVSGNVINGTARIGTAYIPSP